MSDLDESLWKKAVDHARKVLQMVGFSTIESAYIQGYYAGAKRERDGKHGHE